MTTTTTTAADVLANIWRQARYPERAVLLTAEAATVLLEYVNALEERIVELERSGVVNNSEG